MANSSPRDEKVRQVRQLFFKACLDRLKMDGRLHDNCCRVASAFGDMSVHFEWRFPRNQTLEVGLHFENSDVNLNKSRYNAVKCRKTDLEKSLNMVPICEQSRRGGKGKCARVAVEKPYQRVDEDLMAWAVNAMRVFMKTLNPVLSDLKKAEKRGKMQ